MSLLAVSRLVTVLACLGLLGACYAVRPVQPGPTPEAVAMALARHPEFDLRLTDTAGAQSWLIKPILQADTLHGLLRAKPRDSAASIPLSSLRTVAASQFDRATTIATIGLFLVGVAIAFVSIPREETD